MDLISLVVYVILVAVVFGVAFWFVEKMELASPFRPLVLGLIGLIGILLVLSLLFGGISVPTLKIR